MKKITVLLILTVAMSINCWSAERTYGNATVSKLESVIDGDSFKVSITSWPIIIGESIEIRVNGVDTPEMHGKCEKEIALAKQAKDFTTNFLTTTKKIYIKNLSRDKYFRIDADVIVDGKSLAPLLLANGLGYVYSGGTKKDWCTP